MARFLKEESILDELRDKIRDLKRPDRAERYNVFFTVVIVFLLMMFITAVAVSIIVYFKHRGECGCFVPDDEKTCGCGDNECDETEDEDDEV